MPTARRKCSPASRPALPPEQQFARRLVELGCQVVVPVLIDREHTWSGNPAIRMTDQPHREYVYRMACEMGRHVIGYEVQKLLALVDFFAAQPVPEDVPVGVFGYGEGGLLALYSGALDERIAAVGVSGYFPQPHPVVARAALSQRLASAAGVQRCRACQHDRPARL